MNFYTKDDPARQIGSGLADLEAGLRLRYELTRKVAPYIRVSYDGKFGGTADFARAPGAPTDQVRFTTGLRLWFCRPCGPPIDMDQGGCRPAAQPCLPS